MAGSTIYKFVGETLTVTFDFTDRMLFGSTLSAPVTTSTVSTGVDSAVTSMISGAASVVGKAVTQRITLGKAGVCYALVCNVQDGSGNSYAIQKNLAVISTTGSYAQGHGLIIVGTLPAPANCPNVYYNQTLAIVDGYAPFQPPTISSGAMPVGWSVSIVGSTIMVDGTATAVTPAIYTFTIRLADFVGNVAYSTQTIAIAVCTAPASVPASPLLLVLAVEYKAPIATLPVSGSDLFPATLSFNSASSKTGLVVVGQTVGTLILGIFRWSGTTYVNQTVTGYVPSAGAYADYDSSVITDNGIWVITAAHWEHTINTFYYNGSGYTAGPVLSLGVSPRGICFSSDETKLAVFTADGGLNGSLRTYSFNKSTGVLASIATTGSSDGNTGAVDWYGNYIIHSRSNNYPGFGIRIYNASSLALIVQYSTRASTKAFWSADGQYIYWATNQGTDVYTASFTGGNTVTLLNTYTQPNGCQEAAMTSARTHLAIMSSTAATNTVAYAVTGSTMTILNSTLAYSNPVWTNLA